MAFSPIIPFDTTADIGAAAIPTFKNIAQRDAFFSVTENSQLLETGLPVLVNQGNAVTVFVWTGADNPVTYDPNLFVEQALNSGPGTLFLGLDGTSLSSAAKVINFNSAYGDKALGIGNFFGTKGSVRPFMFDFEKELVFIIANVFDTQLSQPQEFVFVAPLGPTYTKGLLIRPATSGTLSLKGYAGTLNTDPIIVDTTFQISAGDIGNVVVLSLPNGLLSTVVDEQLLVFDGVDLFGGLQTSGDFSGQTKPFLQAVIQILESSALLNKKDMDQYIALNDDHTAATVKSGGIIIGTFPTATADTFTDAIFIPGFAATSNPTVQTDGSNTFSPNEIVLIRHGTDLLDVDINDGFYEVASHVGTTLTIKGVGTIPITEDSLKDQFTFIESTGTITKVEVSVLKLLGTQIFHGGSSSTPLTFHVLAHADDVPIVATEEFANTNNRFFGELGLPASQQTWADIATGSASIDLVTDEIVFGVAKQVVLHNDNSTNGSTTSKIFLNAQSWIDINAFGASYGGTSRLGTINGANGFFSGLQANATENPLATGNRRYGILFNDNGGNLRITEADNTGNNVTMDGTNGNPVIAFDEYFNWECLVPAGLGAAQFFINGGLVTFVPTFFVNAGGLGTQVSVSSGSTGGANRVVFHDNFGVTIYEESATKTLAVATMLSDIAQIFVPEGKRDYTIILPDGNPRKLGTRLDFILQNKGGKLKITTENLGSPESIFNGLREVERDIVELTEISLTNIVASGNIYVGEFEDAVFYEHSGLISSGDIDGVQGMSIQSDTIFRIEKIRAVIVDRSLNTDNPTFTNISLPQTDHTIAGGGDQVINTYINKQGVFEFRTDAPTIAAITDEIFVGKTVMVAGVITVAVFTPVVAYTGSVDGLAELLTRGGQKTSGSILSTGGANLTLSVTAGEHQQLGRGFLIDSNTPNLCSTLADAVVALTPSNSGRMRLVHGDAGGNFIVDADVTGLNPDIDPVQFNNGGTLASVSPNNFTAMRVIHFCGTNDIIVYYGTIEYANMAAAEAGFMSEAPETLTTKDGSWICTILVKENVTDLTAGVIAGDVIFKNRSGKRDL